MMKNYDDMNDNLRKTLDLRNIKYYYIRNLKL